MIKVKFNNKYIKISGHADFKDAGKDIVCASVSSIIYTTVSAIRSFNISNINVDDNKKDMIIKYNNEDYITGNLIDNMLDILQELELQYPKNISVSKGE